MNTVVCLTLAKWETVSGQFGGYLTDEVGAPPFVELHLQQAFQLVLSFL